MEWTDYLRFLLAFIFVIGLMGGLYLVLRRFNMNGMALQNGKRRMKIVESLMIDTRHRAVILQCDDKQHLVILNPSGETIVETGITAPSPLNANDTTPHA